MSDATGSGEDDTLDRELIELLNELRVLLPGVQVLLAFLLTVPFTQRFARTTDLQRDVFFATLVVTALSITFLVAPTAFHRLRFRQRDKKALLRWANRWAITGMAMLALAVCGVVFLVTDLIFSVEAAAGVAAGLALVIALLWFAVPLGRRAQA